MKKFILVPLLALLMCFNVFAVEVSNLAELKSALATGGDIILTGNVTDANELLIISKKTTINGNGYHIYGNGGKNAVMNAKYLFQVKTNEAVVIKNIVLFSKSARCIVAENVDNVNISLNDVTLNSGSNRGVDLLDSESASLTISNSTIQLVEGLTTDAYGNPAVESDYYDKKVLGSYSRGVNIGRLTNSTIKIDNSTLQGFYYNINNIGGTMVGTKVIATNVSFKGRCALNVWGVGGYYEINDCSVTGINNWAGPSESFACFVFNNDGTTCCENNTCIINGGTIASAFFDATGKANPNARQFFIRDQGKNNVIEINNAQYTCEKGEGPAGNSKGGVVEYASPTTSITINGGTYDCPEIVEGFINGDNPDVLETGTNVGSIVINGGTFTTNTVSDNNMDNSNVYSALTINGGTFAITTTDPDTGDEVVVDIADLVDPNNAENTLLGNTSETIENQDGTVSVVPQGTEAATEKVDPAIQTDLVWGTDVAMTAQNVVVQPTQTLTLNSGTANAYRLDMGQNATVIVKSGSTLNIGEGGVALNNAGDDDPQIIVEQGATLVLNGLMYGSVPENLIIKASAASYGQLLVNPNVQAHGDNHPNGTFEFVTRSFYENGDHYQYERFGIPTYTTVESVECDVDGLYTGIYVYENEDWQDLGYLVKGTPFANTSRLNTPFATCNLIAYNYSASPSNATYSFKGGLTGNSNASLNCNLDWNPFANSYTADVDAALFLSGLGSDANVTKAIYIAVPQGQGQYRWDGYDPELVAEYLADNGKKLVVRPMQAFILRNKHMAEIKTINYQNAVWNPGTSAGAPARVSSVSDNTARVRIMIDNGQGLSDYLNLTESATYASKVDKYMNDDVNIYAHDADDLLTILSAEDIQDTYVGFSTVQGGNFTISFPKATGRAFTLVDLETGAEVDAEQGNTYSFSAEPNTNADYRFKLVERKKVVTGISNLTDDSNAKGIYTIMGQYLGEMNIWNTLPAGVYVVDGEKRVK